MKRKFKSIFENKSGSAMIMVLCCMAVLVVLVSSLLLSSASTVSTVNQKVPAEQCRIAADSMGRVIEREMTAEDSSIQDYLYKSIVEYMNSGSGWAYYNPYPATANDRTLHSKKVATRVFDLSGYDKSGIGDIKLKGYWRSNGDYRCSEDVELTFVINVSKDGQVYNRSISYYLKPVDEMDEDTRWNELKREQWVWYQGGIEPND